MGNEPTTLGLDDATIDVDCLLVEPLDGNVSMDSVMCFNEKKMTDNSMDSEAVSRRYGRSETATTRNKENIRNEDVHDAMPSGAGFQIHDHFCSMGDDYLLGVEYTESITNIDYGLGEGFQASVSDSQIQVPSAVCFSPWKSEIVETPHCRNGHFSTESSELDTVPIFRDCGILAEENSKNAPELCTSPNIDYRSDEGFQASVLDSRIPDPGADCVGPWKSEMNEIPDYQNGHSITGYSLSNNVPDLLNCTLPPEETTKNTPVPCTSQNIYYGSGEVYQASASDSRRQVPGDVCTSPWKSDVIEVPYGRNTHFNTGSSESNDVPILRGCKFLSVENWKNARACTSQNTYVIHDKSRHSPRDSVSDEDEGRLSSSDEMVYSPKVEKNDEEMVSQDNQKNRLRRQRRASAASAQGSCSDALPVQKRLRKPTQRYINEFTCPITPKKRREVSSVSPKDESTGARGRKKFHTAAKAARLDEEEFSVKAIQVPFGSIVNQECPERPAQAGLQRSDRENITNRSKGDPEVPDNLRRKNGSTETAHLKKRNDFVTRSFQKKADDCETTVARVSKRNTRLRVANEKKKDDWVVTMSPKKKDTRPNVVNHHKKRNDCVISNTPKKVDTYLTAVNHHKKRDGCMISIAPKKGDTHSTVVNLQKKDDLVISTCPNKRDDHCVSEARRKKRDNDDFAEESPEQVSGKRKHHRLWTISEVRKLLDGVSQYGVGRWSRIKKLFFASSAHRTSVDLKDKWRNLLKASGLHDRRRNGDKKRSVAWRPLPKSILRHVRELASMHPYPKGQGRRANNTLLRNDSSDASTDITLSDYRKILQSSSNGD